MNDEKWKKYIKWHELLRMEEKMGGNFTSSQRIYDINFLEKEIDFKDKKVLDIGCDDGEILEYLKRKHNCEITGLSLGRLKKDFIKYGDMHEPPFEDNVFDIVLIMHTLEHSISPYIVLKEINRILKQEGIIVIIMPEEGDLWTSVRLHYSVLTFRQLFNLLIKTGFSPIIIFRKEYAEITKEGEKNQTDWKRDMIVICKKKELGEDIDNENLSFIVIPQKGETMNFKDSVKLTPIFCITYRDGNANFTSFFGRTDSLKNG